MAATGDSVKSKCSLGKSDFLILLSAKILFWSRESNFILSGFTSGKRGGSAESHTFPCFPSNRMEEQAV
jgi:hypothetical protein